MRNAVRHHPLLAALVGGVILALIAGIGYTAALAVQPDPTVRSLPMSYQTPTTAVPIANTGVDANGLTLDQYVSKGGKSQDYRPVPVTTVRAGTLVYVLRYQEFRNKMAEPMVHRDLLCGKVSVGKDGTPIVDVDGLVPYTLGAIPAPTRTDGAAVKNHPVPIPAAVMLDAEGKPIAGTRTCVYKTYAKFIKNPVQSVDIYFKPVALTIVAGAVGTTQQPARGPGK